MKLGNLDKNNRLTDFLEILKNFSKQNPYPNVNLPNNTTSQKIVNRLYASSQKESKEWTEEDIELIDNLLLTNNEKIFQLL